MWYDRNPDRNPSKKQREREAHNTARKHADDGHHCQTSVGKLCREPPEKHHGLGASIPVRLGTSPHSCFPKPPDCCLLQSISNILENHLVVVSAARPATVLPAAPWGYVAMFRLAASYSCYYCYYHHHHHYYYASTSRIRSQKTSNSPRPSTSTDKPKPTRPSPHSRTCTLFSSSSSFRRHRRRRQGASSRRRRPWEQLRLFFEGGFSWV